MEGNPALSPCAVLPCSSSLLKEVIRSRRMEEASSCEGKPQHRSLTTDGRRKLEDKEKHSRLQSQEAQDSELITDNPFRRLKVESSSGESRREPNSSKRQHSSRPDEELPNEELKSTCCGCFKDAKREDSVILDGSSWHLHCFRCQECHIKLDSERDEFIIRRGYRPYHHTCYKLLKSRPKEEGRGRCIVCRKRFHSGTQVKYHSFWRQEFCPSHEQDGTASCCSCERLEPLNGNYLQLEKGRKLCNGCSPSAIIDPIRFVALLLDVKDFFQAKNLKLKQEFPVDLVESQALNAVAQGESRSGQEVTETRGVCISEVHITRTVVSPGKKLGPTRMLTSSRKEITAILILNGFPRVLTGSILAHNLMHAWFRLNGLSGLREEVEQGMCQVMAYLWLRSQRRSSCGSAWFSSSAASNQETEVEFEQKLQELFEYQIESECSLGHGEGFRRGMKAVNTHGVERTIHSILKTADFPN